MIEYNSIKDPTQESNNHKGRNPLENFVCNKLEMMLVILMRKKVKMKSLIKKKS